MAISIPVSWTPWQRFGFRWFFAYSVLFILSNQFFVSGYLSQVWEWVIPRMATWLLGVEPGTAVLESGSGDGLYNYLSLLWFGLLATFIAAVWSWLGRRGSYPTLLQVLLVLLRYYLVVQMAIYGVAKLLYLQFREPPFHRLLQPYGDSSPMGLLWTFMGHSYGYNLFTGGGELLGALLLLFRRTTTLGALVTFGVMANVMVLNFCYDVPVKILSTHLVLFCLALIALDGRRLVNLFLLNRPTHLVEDPGLFAGRRFNRFKYAVKALALLAGAIGFVYTANYLSNQPRPALYGLYEVETMVVDGDTLPPLLTDEHRWRHLAIEFPGRAAVQAMPGALRWYDLEVDTVKQTAVFSGDSIGGTLQYERAAPGRLVLSGQWQHDSIWIAATRKTKADFLLTNRGFHWVNETPLNQ